MKTIDYEAALRQILPHYSGAPTSSFDRRHFYCATMGCATGTRTFEFYARTLDWRCTACGASGTGWESLVAYARGLDAKAAKAWVKEHFGDRLPAVDRDWVHKQERQREHAEKERVAKLETQRREAQRKLQEAEREAARLRAEAGVVG